MGGIFQYDSTFSRVLNRIVDFFYASVLWLIACIPIITIGTSTTALFTVARRTLKEDRGYVFQTFKDTFKAEFKQTTIMWLIEVAIYLVLAFCRMIMRVFLEQGSPLRSAWLRSARPRCTGSACATRSASPDRLRCCCTSICWMEKVCINRLRRLWRAAE